MVLDGTGGAGRVRVRNAGTIAPDVLPHVFDPFGGGAPGARADGLGLGLYIVQQIVLAHQGSIDVESTAGHTAFRLRIPRTASEVVRL